MRFLCDSPRPCRLRTASFWFWWQVLSCVLTTCQGFMGLGKPSSPVTTSPNRIPYLKDVVGGRMRSRAKISPMDRGPILTEYGLLKRLSYVRASRSQAYDVLIRFFPLHGLYRFESLWYYRLWVTACRSMFRILLWIRGFGYGYEYDYIIIMIIVFAYLWCWHRSTFCLFMLVLVCRSKHRIWLNLKWLK
jgi:hypothetical protein